MQNSTPSRLVWLLRIGPITVVAILVFFWWGRSGERPDEEGGFSPTSDPGVGEHASPALPGSDRTEGAVPSEPEETIKAEDYLAEFWGTQWPEVREEIAEKNPGILTRELSPDELPPPWDEIADEIYEEIITISDVERESIRMAFAGAPWPQPPGAEFLAEEFSVEIHSIDAVSLTQAQVAAEEWTPQIEVAADEMLEAQKVARERIWQTQSYAHSPWAGVRLGEEEWRPAFGATATSYKGWCVGYGLFHDEHPEVQPIEKRLKRLQAKRRSAVGRALRE